MADQGSKHNMTYVNLGKSGLKVSSPTDGRRSRSLARKALIEGLVGVQVDHGVYAVR